MKLDGLRILSGEEARRQRVLGVDQIVEVGNRLMFREVRGMAAVGWAKWSAVVGAGNVVTAVGQLQFRILIATGLMLEPSQAT